MVGIGASAGGLEACRKFLDALPAASGMALVLVQHLDPTHESMMVDLLADHTPLSVRQAVDGMPIESEHLYVIPPGAYLSVGGGVLHLVRPQAPHGARLPFDFLLHSLAAEFGARAGCVILSGTGADGSLGLRAIKDQGGIVIAQDPDEAGYDGMPRSAMETDLVDLVLPAAQIPQALIDPDRRRALVGVQGNATPADVTQDWLTTIIDLLRTKTAHDFRLYKPGTLQRRIERRMAIAGVEPADADRYVEVLRSSPGELDLLAKDLLINVTGFFRDPKVFDFLTEKVVPALLHRRGPEQPLRIWVAGCSTGEETYSLAMILREQVMAADRSMKLQFFASDVDADAVAVARDGLYPEAIAADVSPARLSRFFLKEERGYRILPDLRESVVFAVQDVLADPPFSRLDLISCRNLLIYLRPEAQAKVISIFHFALREGGILLLGASETAGNVDGRFEVLSKSEQIYRRVGGGRVADLGFLASSADGARPSAHPNQTPGAPRETALGEFCRRMVMEAYAPAAILINAKHECLYFLGAADRYLRVASGYPTRDLFSMAREEMRMALRAAIQQSVQENRQVIVAGGRTNWSGSDVPFNIDVRPIQNAGEKFLLICFVDQPKQGKKHDRALAPLETSRVIELERELEASRKELKGAIRNLEIANEEQKAVNEEAMSVNEEYQSTNEELLTSKEELQSLNEELTALNGQLQETLERQRTTSNDLQNILYSTDVATLFLDPDLRIRFFTPATKALFNIIPSDLGRPLADLSSLAADVELLPDAGTVMKNLAPIAREIEARSGAWYIRRILPYRTSDNGVEGVVITFSDISERKCVADALEAAKREAEHATVAKSRFLSAASHDLRQPLQTIALLQGLLAKAVEGEDKGPKLVARLDEAVGAMSGMLNTLLDVNRIEAGTVQVESVNFPINDLLERLRREFSYYAQAKKIAFRAVPCGLWIQSDPRLLEQIIRNLLSNALKYTMTGKVLLGCRRKQGMLSIEVWDTGIGIPDEEAEAIFEEYHQVDNPARERNRGLGLGLFIVQRLADLLGHRIRVRSRPNKGSVFAIEIMLPPGETGASPEQRQHGGVGETAGGVHRGGSIVVVEDDPDELELLDLALKSEGYSVLAAPDSAAALRLVDQRGLQPDIILSDYKLPGGLNGLELGMALREKLHREIPVVILTGDISTATLRDIVEKGAIHLSKPVKLSDLEDILQSLLRKLHTAPRRRSAPTTIVTGPPIVFVVDDDSHVREAIRNVLEEDGREIEDYEDCETFLKAFRPGREACLVIDAYLPGMSGLELLRHLKEAGHRLPAIMITAGADVSMAVEAMKAGASDFLEKPIANDELLACIGRALEQSRDSHKLAAWRELAANLVATLTPREREILDRVLAGHPSKNIAADLGISRRTVENHRAAIMKKTATRSIPALARLALAASENAEHAAPRPAAVPSETAGPGAPGRKF